MDDFRHTTTCGYGVDGGLEVGASLYIDFLGYSDCRSECGVGKDGSNRESVVGVGLNAVVANLRVKIECALFLGTRHFGIV